MVAIQGQNDTLTDMINERGLNCHQEGLFNLYSYLKHNIYPYLCPQDIQLLSSGGSSVVIKIRGQSQIVYQYFQSFEISQQIWNFCKNMNTSREQTLQLPRTIKHMPVHYDLSKYLVNAQEWWPELKAIVWDQVTPVSELTFDFLHEHYHQLVWDIHKALNGLHSQGYAHGDCNLDNIGWKAGHFVLYDYNLCRQITPDNPENDYFNFGLSLANSFTGQFIPYCKRDYHFFLMNIKQQRKITDSATLIDYLEVR